jgi:hypothetical protein
MARTRIVVTSTLACLALAVPFTGTASAAPGKTELVLSTHEQIGTLGSAQLRCDPPSGSHGQAGQACRDLAAADGDFTKLPGDPNVQACTMELRPVTVSAQGNWRGKPVAFSREYPNRCVLQAETGPVFAF